MQILRTTRERDLGGRDSRSFGQVIIGVELERVDVETYDCGPIETRWRCRVSDYDQTREHMDQGYYTDLRSTASEATRDGREALAQLNDAE